MWNEDGSLAVVDHVIVMFPPDVTVVEGLLTVRERADKGRRARAKMEDSIANGHQQREQQQGRSAKGGKRGKLSVRSYLNTKPRGVTMLRFSFFRLHGVLLSIQKNPGES